MPSVEIHFGTVYKVANTTDLHHVITNIGEGSWFYSNRIHGNGDSQYLSPREATSGIEDIESIVGRWTKPEVLSAFKIGCQELGYDQRTITILTAMMEKAAKKASRLIEEL